MTGEAAGTEQREELRRIWLTRVAVGLAILLVLGGLWWLLTQRGRVSTDNAYVGADVAVITPMVSGQVKDIRFANTEAVRQGDILVILDDADAAAELAAAEAELLAAQQQFNQAKAAGTALDAQVEARAAGIEDAEAQVAAAQAEYDRASDAVARRESLSGTGAVSTEELKQARTRQADARAALTRAQAGLSAARATRASAQGDLAVNEAITRGVTMETNPRVAAARARVKAARLALDRTIIRSPITGVVSNRQVAVGQRVTSGKPLMAVVPVDELYVDANFKETQLRNVRRGQPVEMTSDLYGGGVVFRGKVVGLSGGTGAAFALLPPQNATGNWVKVVQRVPVRIALEPADVREHPLRVGLSMEATIDTRSP